MDKGEKNFDIENPTNPKWGNIPEIDVPSDIHPGVLNPNKPELDDRVRPQIEIGEVPPDGVLRNPDRDNKSDRGVVIIERGGEDSE